MKTMDLHNRVDPTVPGNTSTNPSYVMVLPSTRSPTSNLVVAAGSFGASLNPPGTAGTFVDFKQKIYLQKLSVQLAAVTTTGQGYYMILWTSNANNDFSNAAVYPALCCNLMNNTYDTIIYEALDPNSMLQLQRYCWFTIYGPATPNQVDARTTVPYSALTAIPIISTFHCGFQMHFIE